MSKSQKKQLEDLDGQRWARAVLHLDLPRGCLLGEPNTRQLAGSGESAVLLRRSAGRVSYWIASEIERAETACQIGGSGAARSERCNR
jgi:hypothetical protein